MQNTLPRNFARASLGAVGVAAAIAFAPATAAAQTNIYGGGATLPSLTLRQLFDCYSGNAGAPAVCTTAVNSAYQFFYASVGSGAGLNGWVTQDPARFGSAFGPSGATPFPDVNFGVSESALTSAQLAAFNNGGVFVSGINIANSSDACVSPLTGTGGDTVPPAPCYDNPRVENGAPIQFPLFGTPVTIAYDPVYKRVRDAAGTVTEFFYQVAFPRPDGSGGLRLTRNQYCTIFSGGINRWDDAGLTATNGGTALWPDPADTSAVGGTDTRGRALSLVVRDDNSGTTTLFTRHLRAVCSQWNTNPLVPAATATMVAFPGNNSPGSIPAGDTTTCQADGNSVFANLNLPGRIFYARGNEGVSNCINTPELASGVVGAAATTVGGRIGYLSPDFALPAVNNLAPGNVFRLNALHTADLQTRNSTATGATPVFVSPAPANVTAALEAIRRSPLFPAVPVGADRADPLKWAYPGSAQLAGGVENPAAWPGGATSYPISGTTNFLGYTCYSNGTKLNALARANNSFLQWLMQNNSTVQTVLTSNGFAPLPGGQRTAIRETFLTQVGPAAPLGLYMRVVTQPTPPGAASCTSGS